MHTYFEIRSALLSLKLSDKPVIAHASLKSFGLIEGGAQTLLRAVLDSVSALIMPDLYIQNDDHARGRAAKQRHYLWRGAEFEFDGRAVHPESCLVTK